MTIVYKVQGYNLTTSNLTTVLTIDASSRAIIKEITIANDTISASEVDLFFRDASEATSYKFFHNLIGANSTDNAVNNTLVLEESDSLKFQADTANSISGQISYALINRSQQNG